MKARALLALLPFVLALPLAGCPKKHGDEDKVEAAEGSSSSDKSGEGSSEEMKEAPAKSSDAAPADEPKKD
jgi:hypothetical protein